MSLYNMINGVNPSTFFVLPMLGKHAEEYPRFRDCFIGDEERPQWSDHIHVYTRVGGGNRESYEGEIAALRAMPEYVTDHDDLFDSTFATFVFAVPEEWRSDFEKIKAGDIEAVSIEYQRRVRQVYPKLNEKLDSLWPESKEPAQ